MSVNQLLQQSISDLAGVAGTLEEGQARRPLYDRVAEIYESLNDECLKVVLLTFKPVFFERFVQNVVPDFPAVGAPRELGINTGFNRIISEGVTTSYTDRQSLFDSLQERVQSGDTLQRVCVEINGIEGLATTRLYIVDPERILALDLPEYSRLANASPLLLISAPLEYSLSGEERAVISQLFKHVQYLSVLALPAEGGAVVGKPWYQESIPVHVKTFTPVKLSPDSLPEYLVDARSSSRAHLLNFCVAMELSRVATLVNAQIEDKIHFLECCQEADDFTLTLLESDPEVTAKIEKNKKIIDSLTEQLEGFSKALQETSKHSLVGKGAFYHMVENELDALKPEDIEKEQVHNVYKLSITPTVLKAISNRLVRRLGDRFADEDEKIKEQLNSLVVKARSDLTEWPKEMTSGLEIVDGLTGMTAAVEDHLDFKIRYKGEMPKRGFLKRVGEGRRAMFMVLMMFSIFGGMLGFNYRNYAFMSVLFVGLFLGGIIWTYVSWRKDDEFKMAGEVEKARDQLHAEYIRAVSEVERNRVRAIADHVSEVVKRNKQDFDVWQKQAIDGIKQRIEDLKEKDKSKKSMLKADLAAKCQLKTRSDQILQRNGEIQGALRKIDDQMKFS